MAQPAEYRYLDVKIEPLLSIIEDELSELSTIPQFFPFVFDVTHEWIYRTGFFELSNIGGKAVLMDE